jgi:hypothetical protein
MAIFRRCFPAELAPDLGVPPLNGSLPDVGDNGGGGDSPNPDRFLSLPSDGGGVVECRMLASKMSKLFIPWCNSFPKWRRRSEVMFKIKRGRVGSIHNVETATCPRIDTRFRVARVLGPLCGLPLAQHPFRGHALDRWPPTFSSSAKCTGTGQREQPTRWQQ